MNVHRRNWFLTPNPLTSCDPTATLEDQFYQWNVFVIQSLSHVWLFLTPFNYSPLSLSQETLPSLKNLPETICIELVMLSKFHIILLIHFPSWFQYFLRISIFSNDLLFTAGGKSINFNFSISSSSWFQSFHQGWFTLGLTHLISQQLKGILEVLLSRTFQKDQFFSVQKSVRVYWKDLRCDTMGLYWPCQVIAF